jgi:hypothetical protein
LDVRRYLVSFDPADMGEELLIEHLETIKPSSLALVIANRKADERNSA